MLPSRLHQIQNVIVQAFLYPNLPDFGLQPQNFLRGHHGLQVVDGFALAMLGEHLFFRDAIRVADPQTDQEAIQLTFRQRISSLKFIRVLRSQH